ncbi:hypothetical protein Tco_0957829 [Tanacetum coccineum]
MEGFIDVTRKKNASQKRYVDEVNNDESGINCMGRNGGYWRKKTRNNGKHGMNVNNKSSNTVQNKKDKAWPIHKDNLNAMKKTANKYAVLSEINDDERNDFSVLKDEIIVDQYLNKKLQPSIQETKDWAAKTIIIDPIWMLAGDFNVTLKFNEHSDGGSSVTSDMQDLIDCVNDIEIEDICFMSKFREAYGQFFLFVTSDHSVVLTIPRSIPKKFKAFSNKYERLKKIPKELRLGESIPLLEQDPSLPRRKRKGMKLEPETYIVGLHCRSELPAAVKFVNNLVIEQLEHGLFFIDAFGDEAFQRVYEVHKVETETLLGYKFMALNVKTDANQRFIMLMSEMINKRPDKDRILSKRAKLESL